MPDNRHPPMSAHSGGIWGDVQPSILPERRIHFGTVVGRKPLWATVSVLVSHRSDDSGPKVGRWPTFGGFTVPKWIPLLPDMGGRLVSSVVWLTVASEATGSLSARHEQGPSFVRASRVAAGRDSALIRSATELCRSVGRGAVVSSQCSCYAEESSSHVRRPAYSESWTKDATSKGRLYACEGGASASVRSQCF
jgi:hypothetical protein